VSTATLSSSPATSAAAARPGRGARRERPVAPVTGSRAQAQAGRAPRLLLPPVCEPPGAELEGAHLLPPALRSARSPATDPGWPAVRPVRPEPPRLPDPGAVCGPVVLAAVEALAGTRPLAQLVRWVTPTVYDALADRTPTGPATGPAPRATVRRSRVCRVGPGVAEASVVVHDGARVRAAALRLEVHRGRWRATALQIG
jgi:hypothetical protein